MSEFNQQFFTTLALGILIGLTIGFHAGISYWHRLSKWAHEIVNHASSTTKSD